MTPTSKRKKKAPDEDYFAFIDEVATPPAPGTRRLLRPGEWPEEVPVLVAADICRDRETKGAQHDLYGWLEATFACRTFANPCFEKAYYTLLAVVRKRSGADLALWEFCRREELKKEQIADVWNTAMRRLGYDVAAPDD